MIMKKQCPKCGTELTADGLEGLCPKCLGNIVFNIPAFSPTPPPDAGTPAVGARTSAEDRDDEAPTVLQNEKSGDRIGRYRLLEQIGEGGFGAVWMAEQERPIRRRVALKIIKLGMDTQQVVARFESERQALALMDHPHIAQVFDGGATASGRPYFVMELVRGDPIIQFCDANRLAVRERLELFLQVCQAVQHAHQKGVIHRDLKPSNILVGIQDDRPMAKVIDFGVAKATQQRLTEKTLFTRFHQVIGTPTYMSPEQAGLGGLDIDTRSDIYSLGVLLYELLTGRTPFDTSKLLTAGYEAVLRTIREEEPPKPSTRLSTLNAEELATVATRRQAEAQKLNRLVRGELDWVVMKALEKDRRRRYETASALAMDLQHFLRSEPVLARPPSNLYRFQKMVQRNKLAFAAASAVTATLLIGLGLSTWQYHRAVTAEREQGRLLIATQKAQVTEAQLRQRAEITGSRLQEALSQMELQRAEELFDAGDSGMALAYLARVVRQNPNHRVAAERLMSALTWSGIAIPLTGSLKHDGRIASAQFSPDGQLVVTASYDRTARVWDAQTGQLLFPPLRHEADVRLALFSPDGQRILTLSSNLIAQVWDAHTGQPLFPPLRHEGIVNLAQFSPDGRWIVTGSEDRTARVWDAQTGQPLFPPLKHEGFVNLAQFSPDGRRLVTGSEDQTARVWDMRTGQPLTPRLQHETGVGGAKFSLDGRRVVTLSRLRGIGPARIGVRLWNAQTGQLLAPPLSFERTVNWAHSPDGQRLVTGTWDASVQIWDVQTGQPLTPLLINMSAPSVSFSPDGQRILAYAAGEVRIWDAQTAEPLKSPLKHAQRVLSAQFSPDGQRVLTVSEDDAVRLWDAQTGRLLTAPLRCKYRIASALFSPDGQRIMTVSSSSDNTFQVWEVKIGQPLPQLFHHKGQVTSVQFSPDGHRVLTASSDQTARVWDAHTGQPIAPPLSHAGSVASAQFSPDSRRVVTASHDKTARVWDTGTGQPITPPLKHQNNLEFAQFSPDGQRVVTASWDKTARVWDAQTGQPITPPFEHGGIINFAQFSPDGQRVVTASTDKTARVWEARTGQPITPPLKHEARVHRACFSPDGQRILTASFDRTARLWDARTGQPIGPPLKHEAEVHSAQFSPDGSRIVTASPDRTARVWDARTGQLLVPPLRHLTEVHSAQFSLDGRRILTGSWDFTARVWDGQTGEPLTHPLRHDSGVDSAQLSPDGQRVATRIVRDRAARIWEVPEPPMPAPTWLPVLAEAVAGQRLNDQRIPEPVAAEEISRLKNHLLQSPTTDLWTTCAKWCLADPCTRTRSPAATRTVPEYVGQLLQDPTRPNLVEAVRLAPTNGLAWAALARLIMSLPDGTNAVRVAQAEWYGRRALQLAPDEPEVCLAWMEALGLSSRIEEALEITGLAVKKHPGNPALWLGRGRILDKANRLADAFQAYAKAIELAPPDHPATADTQMLARLDRAKLLSKQHRFAEAGLDICAARNIPLRDAGTGPCLIDLSPFYTHALTESLRLAGLESGSRHATSDNDLSELKPFGVKRLPATNGIEFDVRGLIGLLGTPRFQSWGHGVETPSGIEAVEGIPVHLKARKLHLLHAASMAYTGPEGTPVARLVIHYANTERRQIDLKLGEDLWSWHFDPKNPRPTRNSQVAWTGSNTQTRLDGRQICIYHTSWSNPLPGVEVQSVDFISALNGPAPFLIAITAEP